MNDKKDEYEILLCDAKRLFKTGSFVRKTSLDELPQLLNVLKGNMSLGGPRPLLVNYLLTFVFRRAGLQTSCKAWNYWLGTGKWKECNRLENKI